MKAKAGAIITSVSGSVGGATFQDQRGQITWRNKNSKVKSNSSAQQSIRQAQQVISQAWRNLSQSERDTWLASGPGLNTGFNFFISCNRGRLFIGESIISVAPIPATFPAVQVDSIAINPNNLDSTMSISGDTTQADYVLTMETSKPINTGYAKSRIATGLTSIIQLDGTDIIDFTAAYASRWVTSGPVGSRIRTRVRMFKISTGQSSVLYDDIATVIQTVDPDAILYLNNAHVTNPAFRAAYNTLVIGLKAGSLYSPIIAIYPFSGVSNTDYGLNAKSPQDLDASFRISFSGTNTLNANGYTGDGASGYGNTHINPVTDINYINQSIIVCCASNVAGSDAIELGSNSVIATEAMQLYYGSGQWYAALQDNFGVDVSVGSSSGIFVAVRSSVNSRQRYYNGAIVDSTAEVANNTNTQPIYIGCINSNGAAASFSNKNLSMVVFTDALSSDAAASVTSLIATFLTAVGR